MAFKHTLEYGILHLMIRLIRRLPSNAAYGIIESLVYGVHQLFGWRKQSTQKRIAMVFPESDAKRQKEIRKISVYNLARTLTELIRSGRDPEMKIEGLDETFDAFNRARKKGKGILLVIVHSGNWDLAGVRTVQEGFPMCFIARQQKNDLTYQQLMQVREQNGGTVVDRDDPRLVRKLLSFLRENGIVAVLIDVRARQAGESYSYLGHSAWLANGLGLLAAKSGAEVVPVFVGRRGRHTHFWKPMPARRLEEGFTGKTERNALLQSCLDDLGREVLAHPESYFWFNKRWVLEPF
jgi:Kdo2-lipid IVA lauroyltransferase/acyltransferase